MRKQPKTFEEHLDHESDVDALVEYVTARWSGLEDVKPHGYDKFIEDYTDFDGMDEWETNERIKEEEAFAGFDDEGVGSFNFVRNVAIPSIAYDDICQGREPLRMLFSAIMSYGFAKGQLYGEEKGAINEKYRILSVIHRDES